MERSGDSAQLAASSEEKAVPQSLFDAMREMLWVDSPEAARSLTMRLVENLGGQCVEPDDSEALALPIDVSFGVGHPVVPIAPELSVSRILLEKYLPMFVVDMRRILQVHSQIERNQEDATLDTLTQLSNRRVIGRALGRLQVGEVVVMIDLDRFKSINDTFGHEAGDEVLRSFGRTILASLRGRDFAGRFGGEEFIVILPVGTSPEPFLARLQESWVRRRPYDVTFSAGIAEVVDDASQALRDSDAAMYRAKDAGRDQWEWATGEPVLESELSLRSVRGQRATATFVAYSRLEIPEDHEDQYDSAFQNRLRAVDKWPGFIALEVWADRARPTQYSMVSWWATPEDFRKYITSEDHRRSHARIPTGVDRPKAVEFHRYRIVSQ